MSYDIRPNFVCQDCGNGVYQFHTIPTPDPPRCSVCAWLVEFVPDNAERDIVRARLTDTSPCSREE